MLLLGWQATLVSLTATTRLELVALLPDTRYTRVMFLTYALAATAAVLCTETTARGAMLTGVTTEVAAAQPVVSTAVRFTLNPAVGQEAVLLHTAVTKAPGKTVCHSKMTRTRIQKTRVSEREVM